MAWFARMALLALLTLPAPLRAEVGSEALSALQGLEPLRGETVDPVVLDGRAVIVTFFASWCPPCHDEFRHLKRVAETHGDEVAIVAINVFENRSNPQTQARLRRFLDEHAPPFAVLAGGRDIRRVYDGLDRIPSLFVFAPDGRLAWHFRHARGAERTHVTEADLKKVLTDLR